MMVCQVSACRGPARLRTFSKKTILGRRVSRMRRMLKNSVPRVLSRTPLWAPDFEKLWQGKPAARTSCSGTAGRRDRCGARARRSCRGLPLPELLEVGRPAGCPGQDSWNAVLQHPAVSYTHLRAHETD